MNFSGSVLVPRKRRFLSKYGDTGNYGFRPARQHVSAAMSERSRVRRPS